MRAQRRLKGNAAGLSDSRPGVFARFSEPDAGRVLLTLKSNGPDAGMTALLRVRLVQLLEIGLHDLNQLLGSGFLPRARSAGINYMYANMLFQ